MFTIKVKKNDLIAIIEKNRDEHRGIFEQALIGYRAFVAQKLEEKIERLKEGKTIEESFRFIVPQDHTDDYNRVIDMLKMDLNEEVELLETQYRCYVDNDWDWVRNFAVTNSGYTTLAGTSYDRFVVPE